jgi:hypothetical protein
VRYSSSQRFAKGIGGRHLNTLLGAVLVKLEIIHKKLKS